MQATVTVLGAGSWGTALAVLLAKNGCHTHLWVRDPLQAHAMQQSRTNAKYLPDIIFPELLHVTTDLAAALQSKTIFLAIPSHAFYPTLLAIKPYLNKHHRFVIATKGLDPVLGGFLTETMASVLPWVMDVAMLSGPTFAKDIALGQPSAIALACLSDSLAEHVVHCLHNAYFRVYRTHDQVGVQVGGVVKNILAIATGIAQGLGFGANTQSALITRGLAEMVRLGLALGAQLETFLGLAGVGDLILTATNNQSRNRRFGVLVGEGVSLHVAEQQVQQVVEGIHNAEQVVKLAAKYQVDMPIVHAVYQVLKGHISPREAVDRLLARAPRIEGC